jgi:hypothetical protein
MGFDFHLAPDKSGAMLRRDQIVINVTFGFGRAPLQGTI